MRRIIFTALVSVIVVGALLSFALTRPVHPDALLHQGSLVLQAADPIAKEDQVTSAALQKAVLDRLPATRRVDFEETLNTLAITYDKSVPTQFFITYHYSTYDNSAWKLFFDAPLHNHAVEVALDAAISEVLEKHDARIRPADQAGGGPSAAGSESR